MEFSKRSAQAAGVSARTKFVRGDIFKTDFSDATVVTTFLLPSMNLRLRPTFLALKPGTRIVANTFAIGDWEPDETATIDAVRALVHGDALDRARARGRNMAHAEGRPDPDAAVSVRIRNVGRRTDRERTAQRRGDLVHHWDDYISRAGRWISDARERNGRREAGGMDGAARTATLSNRR